MNPSNRDNKKTKALLNKVINIKLWQWVLICVIAGASVMTYQLLTGGLCFLKRITGFPCPSCGLTRAYLSAMRFDFESALYFHPLFWVVPLMIVVGILASYDNKRRKLWLYGFAALIFAFIICWIVRLITGTAV